MESDQDDPKKSDRFGEICLCRLIIFIPGYLIIRYLIIRYIIINIVDRPYWKNSNLYMEILVIYQ